MSLHPNPLTPMSDDYWYEQVKNGGLEVDLGDKCLGDEESKQVAQALMDPNTRAQHLRLSNNNIGVEGARALAEALKRNSTLQKLYLDNNNIGVEGATALAEALK